jgi:oligopeptide transport system ATP-binding protein
MARAAPLTGDHAGPVLTVENLSAHFATEDGLVKAVDGISFTLARGESLGIVGESGSGKTVTCLSLLGLLPPPPAVRLGGTVTFDGQNLLALRDDALRRLRGSRLAMIFQDPMSALNPYLTVERQLSEVLETHRGMGRAEARQRSLEMLVRIGIPDAKARLFAYPHELSGGMRQRVMIAMALLCEPEILIADEPTTALDVTIQAQILALVRERQREMQTSVIWITHDLAVVAGLCQRILVMYAGRIVEGGPTREVLADPRHPYTLGLLHSLPRLDCPRTATLSSIRGLPPDLGHLPLGCPFAPRCDVVRDLCRAVYPDPTSPSPGREVRCHAAAEAAHA